MADDETHPGTSQDVPDAHRDTPKPPPEEKPTEDKADEQLFYEMNHKRGDFIIIGNKASGDDRQVQDIKLLKGLSKVLGADVWDWTGLDKENIFKNFVTFSTSPQRKKKDFVIVAILSEAEALNKIRDNAGIFYDLQDVIRKMTYVKGSEVLAIPKLFFVQNIPPRKTDGSCISKGGPGDGSYSIHRMADIFISYNKVHGDHECDDNVYCSTYIYILCNALKDSAKNGTGFNKTMIKVHREVVEAAKRDRDTEFQVPRMHSMLRYDVKFTPMPE